MLISKLQSLKDLLHAQLCYQFFITPFSFGIGSHYREFAEMAQEYFLEKRTQIIERHNPRHHVLHHFSQPKKPGSKKVLITHGWMSQSTYMIKLIHQLHEQGYDVYALDFPAHGSAKGFQLPWTDAVLLLKDVLNEVGPFYAAIGHSFGGSMLFNTINLSHQIPSLELIHKPEKLVMISSPVRMRMPVSKIARFFRLNARSYRELKEIFSRNPLASMQNLNFRRLALIEELPILCIHGSEDHYITPMESKLLFQSYPHTQLTIIPGLDHVEVLIDPRVEQAVSRFLHSN